MEFTARQICEMLKGTIVGNPEVKISTLAKIEEAKKGSLSFLGNLKYAEHLYTTGASVIVIARDFIPEREVNATLIQVEDARVAFAKLLELYNRVARDKRGTEQPHFVADTAQIGHDGYIGAFAYIGHRAVIGDRVKIYPGCYVGDGVTIGDDTTLFPGVKIYSDSVIGKSCTLHAGVVIGADGFGFTPDSRGYNKVAQIGNVVIEDEVEIGANTCVDRATLGSTIIRKGVKLDNLIQVGHNVELGENTVIAAQSGVAGSAKVGKNCMVGGQAGIVGHLTVADNTLIAAQSGVGASISKQGQIIQGSPAFAVNDYRRTYVLFRKLPELNQRIHELEKLVAELRQAAAPENKS